MKSCDYLIKNYESFIHVKFLLKRLAKINIKFMIEK